MKIQLLSDLHLESDPAFACEPVADADVLVLAGDIGSYQWRNDGTRMTESDWGLGRWANWPVPVLFVPGNHEYDALDFDDARKRLRDCCERQGMVWLEREAVVIGGVRFLGTTLWSDYDALRVHHGATEAQALAWRQKAFRAANFYLQKMQTQRHGQLFDAMAMREEALLCQAWLREALESSGEEPTVVVTHFAPSLRSADPRYGIGPGTAGFCNALDHLMPHADLWLHGHLHCAHDYRVGRCRVVANPRGYAEKGEQAGFRPSLTVELHRE